MHKYSKPQILVFIEKYCRIRTCQKPINRKSESGHARTGFARALGPRPGEAPSQEGDIRDAGGLRSNYENGPSNGKRDARSASAEPRTALPLVHLAGCAPFPRHTLKSRYCRFKTSGKKGSRSEPIKKAGARTSSLRIEDSPLPVSYDSYIQKNEEITSLFSS